MITKRRRKRKLPIWTTTLILLLMIISAVYLFQVQISGNKVELVSPIVQASFQKGSPSPKSPSTPVDNNLKQVVDSNLEGTDGTYGVVIKNLKTGEHYEYNGDYVFESASLYKLWIMATVYEQEKAGQLSDDQELTESVQSLNNKFGLDSEVAELTDGVIDYSVHDALERMITVSDNYTALLLTSQIKLASVDSFLKEHNFNESSVGLNGDEPTTTASDIASFFEKLDKGQLTDPDYSQNMLNLLEAQQLNNKIPKELPADLVIAHKTGELDSVSHDGGIVYSPNGDYIIVIMSDSANPPVAENRISDISQAVYAYFNKGR